MDMDKEEGDPSDRRHFSRVAFRHGLVLRGSDGEAYQGAFNDVSLKGMLFWCEALPPVGTLVEGEVPLGDESIVLRGEVLRSDSRFGAAIRFRDIDLESFSHLRRLVSLNLGDAEVIDREFFDSF